MVNYKFITPEFDFTLNAQDQEWAIKALSVALDLMQGIVPEIKLYDLVISFKNGSCGSYKISLIKEVRQFTGAGLKESKDFVEIANPLPPVLAYFKIGGISWEEAVHKQNLFNKIDLSGNITAAITPYYYNGA